MAFSKIMRKYDKVSYLVLKDYIWKQSFQLCSSVLTINYHLPLQVTARNASKEYLKVVGISYFGNTDEVLPSKHMLSSFNSSKLTVFQY